MYLTPGKQKLLLLSVDAVLLIFAWYGKTIAGYLLDSESQCPVLAMGIICPACGSTRCAFALASLDLGTAFRYQPALVCVCGYLILLLVFLHMEVLMELPFAKKVRRMMTDYRVILTAAVCYVVFGLSRNFLGDWSHLYDSNLSVS